MNPEYGERYRELFEKHWWWRARTEFILKMLRRLKPPNGWREILDVGCGDGLFFPRLREFGEVEGIEPSTTLVNPSNPDSRSIYVCPFDRNFQPRKQYSLILMLDVLEHLEDPLDALRHARNLLQADGMILMTVPAFKALWTNHDVINHHFTRYTKPRLRRLSAEAGLSIFEDGYFYHWTCPAKMALGTVERILRLKPKPARVPIAWINQLLYLASRLEQETLTRLPMPAGSSLVAIAKHAPSNSPRE